MADKTKNCGKGQLTSTDAKELYEAFMRNYEETMEDVTIPQLTPLVTVLTILAVGNIFRADFGLFYQIPHNAGQLYNVTNVLDVYVYNGLTQTADIGMASAAGLYQSVVGLILVILSNLLARRVDPNSALF